MFINYRRHHNFDKEEEKIIDVLASSAAIAINNRRSQQIFSASDRKILTTLEVRSIVKINSQIFCTSYQGK